LDFSISEPESLIPGPLLPGAVVFSGVYHQTQKETAAFGELSYEIARGLKLTGGARVSRSELDFSQVNRGPLAGPVPVAIEGQAKSTPFTPKAALSYNLSEGSMIYASASKGFRVGGVNDPIPQEACAADLEQTTGGQTPRPTFDPDTTWQYEIGYKGSLLDSRLAVDASAYHIKWSNIQNGISLPGCGFGFSTNFGSAKSDGAELELVAHVAKGLRIRLNGSYTDAQLTSDVLGPVAVSGPDAGQQLVYGLSGDPMPNVPQWTASAGVEYRFFPMANAAMYIRGDYQYVDSAPRGPGVGKVGYNPLTDFPRAAYNYGSARVGIVVGELDVSLFANNIANARPVFAFTNSLAPGQSRFVESSLAPRVFGLSAEWRF
jgi:outer membrane receptor protein involved in Fe transport